MTVAIGSRPRNGGIVRARRLRWARDGEVRLRAYVSAGFGVPYRWTWPTMLWVLGWVGVGCLYQWSERDLPSGLAGLASQHCAGIAAVGGAAVSLAVRPWRPPWRPLYAVAADLYPGLLIRLPRRRFRAAEVAVVGRIGDLVHVTFAPTEAGGRTADPVTFEYQAAVTIACLD